jgi:hypothetical protein
MTYGPLPLNEAGKVGTALPLIPILDDSVQEDIEVSHANCTRIPVNKRVGFLIPLGNDHVAIGPMPSVSKHHKHHNLPCQSR